jgi:protein-disulfide isomerase
LTLTRRRLFLASTGFVIAGTAGIALPPWRHAQAEGAEVDAEDLAKAGPDGDVVLGSEKAPVTIIEYASMTCPHCAHFSENTFPELQKRYIDTGKVRFIFREFPLDALAAAGFMLARCAGTDKFMPVVETLFAKQRDWMV